MRRAPALSLALVTLLAAPSAWATAPGMFGHGPESAALAQADVAGMDPTAAPQINAALAATRGLRLRLGYGYGDLALSLDGADAGVRHASGIDLAAQYGARVSGDVDAGLALAMHFPDQYIARIAFRPATEPQFVRYETSLQRTAVDLVAALRFGPVSLGAGVAGALDLGGEGTDFLLGQDANGTLADAGTDLELPYHFAPIVGAHVALGRAARAPPFRGARSVDLTLDSDNTIALADNPLNGTTRVVVLGQSGYDPPTVDVGTRVTLFGGLTAFAALEYAIWRVAPAPVADVTVEVNLGTTPSQREGRFVEPRFRDTISPRLGLELRRPDASAPAGAPADQAWRWALRAGYVLSPSPVPPQTGFTSYADATRHGITLGGGYRFGEAAGVDLSASLAGQLHLLASRVEEQPAPVLPPAPYEGGGRSLDGSFALEGSWR